MMENITHDNGLSEAMEKLDAQYTDEQLAEILAISDTEQTAEDTNPLEAIEADSADDR